MSSVWITINVERALYVDRGKVNLLCDRGIVGPHGGTLVLKLKQGAAEDLQNALHTAIVRDRIEGDGAPVCEEATS